MNFMPNHVTLFLKKLYVYLWKKRYSCRGNLHLNDNELVRVTLPFDTRQALIRPTMSDVHRVSEYVDKIYFSHTYLHSRLKRSQPDVLIDLGANIGLSSLAFAAEFQSLRNVIAVEADEYNHSVLSKNFELWKEFFPNITFTELHAIISSDASDKFGQSHSLYELAGTGRYSSSGTQRFLKTSNGSCDGGSSDVVAINNLIRELPEENTIMVKIDIEGGEEYLFAKDTRWLERVSYLTIETHDHFVEENFESSRNFIKAIAEYDFSIVPTTDTLHLYNRSILRVCT